MGSFFTNVHVHRGQRDGADVRRTIINALRQLALADGSVEVDPADMSADRVLAIGRVTNASWIAVYDSATESQETNALDALAGTLSTATEGTALGILVHDSDILELRLWRSGEHADTYCSQPEYFGRISRAQRKALAGRPDLWRDLLHAGATPRDLRAAWDAPLLFAEATLARTAELLDMDTAWCGMGLRYLLRGASDAATDHANAGLTLLAFRSVEPPSALEPEPTVAPETVDVTAQVPILGPPTLSPQSGSGGAIWSAGDPLRWLDCAVGNSGAAGVGLQVVIWGSALDRGLITLETLEISLPPVDDATELSWERHTPVAVPVSTGVAHIVRLDSYVLLGETTGWGDAFSSGKWRDPYAAIQARTMRHIRVRLHGQAVTVGSGVLHIGFAPLENPQDGQTSYTFPVEVTRRARRPLRYAADSPATDQYLRDLDNPRVLVALVSLGCDRSTAGQVAADAIEAWNEVLGLRGGRYEGFIHDRFDYRPRSLRVAAEAIPAAAAWRRLRDTLGQAVLIKGMLLPRRSRGRPDHTSGFLFEADSLFLQHGGDTAAPQLLLWADTQGHDVTRIQAFTDALIALVGQTMAQGAGLQALVARWNWSSYYQGSAQSTPYEMACGVHGQTTTGRAWCGRWLRGVSERLWLGPSLAAQLGDVPALSTVAEVTTSDAGMTLELRPAATFDDLERVLAPILPGEDDWRGGVDVLYRRDHDPAGSASDPTSHEDV